MRTFTTKRASKILAISTIAAGMLSSASAFDIKYNGWLEMFGKGGFNTKQSTKTRASTPQIAFLMS